MEKVKTKSFLFILTIFSLTLVLILTPNKVSYGFNFDIGKMKEAVDSINPEKMKPKKESEKANPKISAGKTSDSKDNYQTAKIKKAIESLNSGKINAMTPFGDLQSAEYTLKSLNQNDENIAKLAKELSEAEIKFGFELHKQQGKSGNLMLERMITTLKTYNRPNEAIQALAQLKEKKTLKVKGDFEKAKSDTKTEKTVASHVQAKMGTKAPSGGAQNLAKIGRDHINNFKAGNLALDDFCQRIYSLDSNSEQRKVQRIVDGYRQTVQRWTKNDIEFLKGISKEMADILIERSTAIINSNDEYMVGRCLSTLDSMRRNPDAEKAKVALREEVNKKKEKEKAYREAERRTEQEKRRKEEEKRQASVEKETKRKEAEKQKLYAPYLAKCSNVIMDFRTFVRANPFTVKGKCVEFNFLASLQMLSANSGLFKLDKYASKIVYIESPKPMEKNHIKGIAKIVGTFSYKTKIGTENEVPKLKMLDIYD